MGPLDLEDRVDHRLGPRQPILTRSASAKGEVVSWYRGRMPPPAVALNRACHLAHLCNILRIDGEVVVVPGDTHKTSPTSCMDYSCAPERGEWTFFHTS